MINKVFIDLYIYICKLFAKLEILYNIYFKTNVDAIKRKCFSQGNMNMQYICIKDGKEISNKMCKQDISLNNTEYDFIIKKELNDVNNENSWYGKISDNISDIDTEAKFVENKFLSITLSKEDSEYNIDLEKPINFYIDGNILLDNSFVKWYMNEVYCIDDIESYTIDIVDNNCSIIKLNEISSVEIGNPRYIFSNVDDGSENEDSDNNE